MSVNEKMTNIADAIRNKTGGTSLLSLDDMADGVNDVYKAGKQAERTDFWNAYLEGGARTNYQYAFAQRGWNNRTFKPTFDIKPTNATQMFYYFNTSAIGGFVNLVEILESTGATLDFSKATQIDYCFQNAMITHLGVVDLSSIKNRISGIFSNTYYLETIEKIIVHENISYDAVCFSNCYAINIFFEGVIGNSITFQNAYRTSVESAKSIIRCLKNYAGTDNDGKNTLTFKGSVWTALEASGQAPDGGTWKNYVQSLGWLT